MVTAALGLATLTYTIGLDVGETRVQQAQESRVQQQVQEAQDRAVQAERERDEARQALADLQAELEQQPTPNVLPSEEGEPPATPMDPEAEPTVLRDEPLSIVEGEYWDLDAWRRDSSNQDFDLIGAEDFYPTNSLVALLDDVPSSSYDVCKMATNYSGSGFTLKEGMHLCLQTSDGNLALLRVDVLPDPNADVPTTTFYVTVWEQ